MKEQPVIEIRMPEWTARIGDDVRLATDAERMRLVVELARENVERGTGGPFAAAVFESESGRLVATGVNLVPALGSSMLHAEVVAIMFAQRRVGSFSLAGPDMPRYELVTSCEPCAMCLGAVLWSGVRRLVSGASRDDAQSIGFDEGPVFDASWAHLEARGIEIVRDVERVAARAVLQQYAAGGGVIYNG